MSTRRRAPAFTLIELLVVISVIALLISIALPAIGRARRSAAQAVESGGLRQFCIAYTAYAQDNRGAVIPGYTPGGWVTPTSPGKKIEVSYGDSPGTRLYGSVARRYTWRLAPYLGFARDGIVLDRRLRAEFNRLPDSPSTRDSFQWAYASSPSFGLNSTWVGGDSRRGGFYAPSIARWGKFYITKIDDATFPDRLLIFATSRGYHPVNGTDVVPGRHRIEGPWRASREPGQVPIFTPWAAPPGPFDPSKSPSTYGHLDYRHFGKVLIGMFDGHASAASTAEMTDMRRWSNQADRPDWSPQ